MNIVLAIIIGFAFGYVLNYSGASSPKNIVSMLRLRDITLMKIIIFGIGFASFLLSLSAIIGIFNPSHLGIKSLNLAVVIGGLIFGIGFGTVGTCPGTCVAAVSSGGFKKALAALVGGLLGAFVFSVTYGLWRQTGIFDIMNMGKLTLFKLADGIPSVFDAGYPGLLIVGLFFMGAASVLPQTVRKV